ncbi:transmembrane protein 242 [Vespula pensylvanica]|uniref:transmembrane protein 242 n=1 Tax=Vespula pensylvanica TaxID=30213 RepID=UPI001CBA0AA0|nr:transmembrane protein 242 [Vespula pensylvanica]
MAAQSEDMFSHETDTIEQSKKEVKTYIKGIEKEKEKFYAAIFLSTVTGLSAFIGFGTTLASVRKKDPKYFDKGLTGSRRLQETGTLLAFRALCWGTFYAVTGCGLLFYGIWKISGAKNAEEFRYKMGSLLPKIPKNNPPQSRVEFEGLTDLLTYIAEDWGKKKD